MKEDHRRVDKGVEDNEISGIRSRQNFTGCSSTAKVVNMGYEGNVDKKIGHSLSKTILDHPRLWIIQRPNTKIPLRKGWLKVDYREYREIEDILRDPENDTTGLGQANYLPSLGKTDNHYPTLGNLT
jgi:hypothetical protein